MSRGRHALLLALLAGAPCACATAHNYLDPASPRYEGAHAATPPEAPSTLRVVTFNIEYGRRVDRAVADICAYEPLRDPDILLLQEMDAPGVELVARALGLNYVYFPASLTPKTGRDFGNAVLSPWPIREAWKIPLPHPSRILHQARAAVAATVEVGGRPVRVYSVHFGSPFGVSGGSRADQADAVIADARASEEPVIVGGDLNSHGVGKRFVAAGFSWATEKIGGTRGRFSFDHVFARGLAPSGAGVVREADDASDHRPVWAVLAVPGSGGGDGLLQLEVGAVPEPLRAHDHRGRLDLDGQPQALDLQ